MKICPDCHAEVDNNFELCWNCQYSFEKGRVLDDDEFMQICPKCGAEIEAADAYCRSCQFDMRNINAMNQIEPRVPKCNVCANCNVPLTFMGNFRFHEGAGYGIMGDLFEVFVNKESFNLFSCPKCGKIEFYLPG